MDRWWLYLAKYAPDDGTGGGTDTDDGDGDEDADEGDEEGEDKVVTQADVDNLQKALDKEREAHKRTRQRQQQRKPKADPKGKEPEVRTDWERVNRANLRADLVSAAIGKLADPKLAARLVDLDDFEIEGDGEAQFDEADIEAAINDLIEKHPALAVSEDDDTPRKKSKSSSSRKQDSGNEKFDMDKALRAAVTGL